MIICNNKINRYSYTYSYIVLAIIPLKINVQKMLICNSNIITSTSGGVKYLRTGKNTLNSNRFEEQNGPCFRLAKRHLPSLSL
jgi:hypothetical protein